MANPRIPYAMSSERAALPPLKGKRILVHLVVNVENWQFDQPMPRTIVTPPQPHDKGAMPAGSRAPCVFTLSNMALD
jgi:allantoinase